LGKDYAVVVELEQPGGVLTMDPALVIEVTCKVDKRTKVALQLWDIDRKENVASMTTLEPGKWTTLAVPLRDFGDPAGRPLAKPIAAGDKATCFSVFAGEASETVELLVDDVRFLREP